MAKAGGEKPFWKTKPLAEMTGAEWESLCDGCARCCLEKLEDDDTGEISYTEVACSLLDSGACRCTNYAKRLDFVAECEKLTPENITTLGWIPSTCAYRLIAEGRDLYWWHPLVSGDPETVHQAGISVRGRAIPEKDVDNWEDHIVTWPK